MDSINKNQPEQNHKDLAGKDAIDKLKELVKEAETCCFCTSEPPARPRRPAGRAQVNHLRSRKIALYSPPKRASSRIRTSNSVVSDMHA